MAVQSIGEYPIIMKDKIENFNGNQLVFINWHAHRVVSSPRAFPLPPEMPFAALLTDIIPICYKIEPDFEDLDFDKTEVIWEVDGEVINPDFSKSLKENGVGHKSIIKFITPSLTGKVGV
ncbi:MAG: phenol hydroxylase subunit P4 [Halarcobacter sp.]